MNFRFGIPHAIAFAWIALLSSSHCLTAKAATHLVRLPDGRQLQYAEYGNPVGPLVLYFHGTPGSHLEPAAVEAEIAASGLRVIAVNRPGIGSSSFQNGRQIVNWPNDIACLLSAIRHPQNQFGVIGFSGGAPYALAVARAMPHRVKRISLVSGHAPPNVPGVIPGEEDNLIELFRRREHLANAGVRFISRRARRRPDKVIQRFTKRLNPADRNLLRNDASMNSPLKGTLIQATLRGSQGVVTDVQLLGGNWGFQPCEVQGIPVTIWQGSKDAIVTESMGRYFHAQLPGSRLVIDGNAGHVTMFKWHAAEILAEFQVPPANAVFSR